MLQEDALEGLSAAHAIGQRRALVVLPPGSGKTRIAAEDAKAVNPVRILYVAHTHEILDVAQSEFEAKFRAESVTRLERVPSFRRIS